MTPEAQGWAELKEAQYLAQLEELRRIVVEARREIDPDTPEADMREVMWCAIQDCLFMLEAGRLAHTDKRIRKRMEAVSEAVMPRVREHLDRILDAGDAVYSTCMVSPVAARGGET